MLTMDPKPSLRARLANRRTFLNPTAIAIAAGVVVAGTLAVGWGASAAETSANTARLAAHSKSVESKLENTQTKLDDYKRRSAASDRAQQAASDKASELTQKIAAADALQAQLDAEQQKVVASQISDGVHVVGTDTQPGIYSITSADSCYYAWMTGTGSDADIVDNNIVNGPATVTLKAGDVFETDRCGTWNKTG